MAPDLLTRVLRCIESPMIVGSAVLGVCVKWSTVCSRMRTQLKMLAPKPISLPLPEGCLACCLSVLPLLNGQVAVGIVDAQDLAKILIVDAQGTSIQDIACKWPGKMVELNTLVS